MSYNGGGRDTHWDRASKEADKVRDMTAALSRWDREALYRACGNQVQAKKSLVEAIGFDRRFDGYDAARLADRIHECRSNGRTFDLGDPFLRNGGEARPLQLKGAYSGR
jgi:hypothetical protein